MQMRLTRRLTSSSTGGGGGGKSILLILRSIAFATPLEDLAFFPMMCVMLSGGEPRALICFVAFPIYTTATSILYFYSAAFLVDTLHLATT